jgi:hypothetical protein
VGQKEAAAGVALAILFVCVLLFLRIFFHTQMLSAKFFRLFTFIFILAIVDATQKRAIDQKLKSSAGSVKLRVFRGKKARLNRIIFLILASKKSLTCYELYLEIRRVKEFGNTKHQSVYGRVKALYEEGWLCKCGMKFVKANFLSPLYRLSTQAYVALKLDKTDLDVYLGTAPEPYLYLMLEAVSFS